MDGFRLSYWVTLSLLWALMASATAVLVYFLVSRCCSRRQVDSSVQEDPFSGGPRGVDPKLVETFPVIKYSAAQGKKVCRGINVCVICLGVFKEGETLRSLPTCHHVFHSHCIDAWLTSHATCPYCRAAVIGSGLGLFRLLPAGLARLV